MSEIKPAEIFMNENTVPSYSEQGANEYEDPMNKNFLYGDITVNFLKNIKFRPNDKTVLDIGCGTGFGFDELYDEFKNRNMKGIGVEPADGMLEIAINKYKGNEMFAFHEGSFENIPLENNSTDRIISTLALHWVKSLEVAAAEMRRVLKDDGRVDILMIAKDDGANFKKAIVNALKNHLTFAQIMKTATLVQRVTAEQAEKAFSAFHPDFKIKATEYRDIVHGSFDDHMKWWKARSSPVIAEVENKDQFMADLREELEKIATADGIPFDTAYLWISVKGKENEQS